MSLFFLLVNRMPRLLKHRASSSLRLLIVSTGTISGRIVPLNVVRIGYALHKGLRAFLAMSEH